MSRYYSPRLRKQIADAMELSTMSQVVGRDVGDPDLARVFKKATETRRVNEACVFKTTIHPNVPYAMARVSFSCPTLGSVSNVRFRDVRKDTFNMVDEEAFSCIYCMRNVPGLRLNTTVDRIQEDSRTGVHFEKDVLSLFNSMVNVLVLDSANYTYRLDDNDLDPEEDGGIGGGYFYGKKSDMIFDIMSPGTAPGFVFDALELKTRWVRTTYIKASAYFLGDGVYASMRSGQRVGFVSRALAIEPVHGGSVGEIFLESVNRYAERHAGRKGYHYPDPSRVEGLIEGDSILEVGDVSTARNMEIMSRSMHCERYRNAISGMAYPYPMPFRSIVL